MIRRFALTFGLLAVAGLMVATVAPTASAAPTKKGATYLTLDADAAALLGQLGVTPSLVAPAYVSDGRFAFPVVGRYPAPVIKHVGGIALTAGSTTVTLTNYWIDTQTSMVSGIVDDSVRVDLFSLGASTADGVALNLTAAAADYLNHAFGVSVFAEGVTIAYAVPAPKSPHS